jgi:CDP-glycerol glycerophosphotransferase (TagB/SpsB family)
MIPERDGKTRKTIFMPIFHGHIARNVLMTDIFKILSGRKDLKLVIFTYDFKKEYYQREFARDNVIIEGVDLNAIPVNPFEKIFKFLFSCFVDSPRAVIVFREMYEEDNKFLPYLSRRMTTFILGHCRFLRNTIRRSQFFLVKPKKLFLELFDKYKPDALFLPDMTFSVDNYLLRIGKQCHLPSIAMLRSWDVLTSNKGTIRVKPDKLIVHNEFMKKMAMKWGDVKAKDTFVAGMPHFDYYITDRPTPKEEFFRKIGLDPSRRVILFALTGPRTAGINQDIIDIISKAIDDGRLPSDIQILVRMHPNSDKESFKKNPHAVFHRPEGVYFSQGRLTDMEFTKEWLQELLDTLYYSDITINPQSTMSIDAAAFDKPVINLAFDGYEKLPYIKSVRRLYDLEHYVPVVKSGGVRLAYNEKELIEWINKYLENPSLDRVGRKRMLEEQCYKFDGKSTARTAGYVLDFLAAV